MGYRSDVRAIIYGDTDLMQRFVAAARLDAKHKEVFDSFDTQLHIHTFNPGTPDAWSLMDLRCDDVKWYPDYPDVRAWHDLMREVDEDADWHGLNYEFVRIGEEDGDIEWDRSADCCDYLLETSRPVANVAVNARNSVKGFPDETDQNSTGEK